MTKYSKKKQEWEAKIWQISTKIVTTPFEVALFKQLQLK